jgi:D-proline reductase (dithiol) PrdB
MIATMSMELIEKTGEFENRFSRWGGGESLASYPFIENVYAPFSPAKRALPMTNLALISSAGAYIDGTEPFDTVLREGDLSFREIPIEVEAEDLLYAARGYDAKFVQEDMNAQIPVQRLLEYEANRVIGKLNNVWWTMNGFIPNAARVAEELAPKITARVNRYECQAALLIPASRLCHQTLGIIARAIEQTGIPTMMIAVERQIPDKIRPPRTAFYNGEYGCVAGKPNWKEYQLRVLDESIRWIETLDQPAVRKLAVDLETETENERGER